MSVEDKINELLEQAEQHEEAGDVLELTTEDLDMLSEEELASLIENIDQLDEISQATLSQYVGSQVGTRDIENAATGTSKIRAKLGNKDENQNTKAPKNEAPGPESKDHDIKKNVGFEKGLQTTERNESIDLGELLSGEELSEEFKAKATTIFEAAVAARVAQEVAAYKEELAEEAMEELEELKEGLIDKVDGFLGVITEQWMNKNELALERGIKADLFESFMSGMQSLFVEHYVNVPEEQLDVLEDLQSQVEELTDMVNESTEHNVQLVSALNEVSKAMQIEEATEGLSEVQAEKFKMLAEELVYEDDESFAEKLEVIRENYFSTKSTKVISESKTDFISDAPVTLTEETNVPLTGDMSAYVKAIR